MAERWNYKHDGSMQGPVSRAQLEQLAAIGALFPADLVWPAGCDLGTAVPVEAALRFAAPPPTEPAAVPPMPVPVWLPELAKALESGDDLTGSSNPPPEVWLPDVRRDEGTSRPPR